MKKVLIPAVLLLCTVCQAESMKFITVLSSPVGSFNKLETVDPNTPAYGKTVNFCTKIGRDGTVDLKGVKAADLQQINLSNGATLGKTDGGKYSLANIQLNDRANIQLNDRGSIEGERLFAKQAEVRQSASGYSEKLYGNTLTVAGAKTKDLTVYANDNSRKSSIVGKEDQDSPNMVWSNEYQSDSACGNTDTCAKQYLLKSGSSSGNTEEDDPYKCAHCTSYEKDSAEYNNCVKNSVINIDRTCCSQAYSLFPTEADKKTTKCWVVHQNGIEHNQKAANTLYGNFPKELPNYIDEWQDRTIDFPNGVSNELCAAVVPLCTEPFCRAYTQKTCALSCQSAKCTGFSGVGTNMITNYDCTVEYMAPACIWGWYDRDFLGE